MLNVYGVNGYLYIYIYIYPYFDVIDERELNMMLIYRTAILSDKYTEQDTHALRDRHINCIFQNAF